jgi:hypothetical protein
MQSKSQKRANLCLERSRFLGRFGTHVINYITLIQYIWSEVRLRPQLEASPRVMYTGYVLLVIKSHLIIIITFCGP